MSFWSLKATPLEHLGTFESLGGGSPFHHTPCSQLSTYPRLKDTKWQAPGWWTVSLGILWQHQYVKAPHRTEAIIQFDSGCQLENKRAFFHWNQPGRGGCVNRGRPSGVDLKGVASFLLITGSWAAGWKYFFTLYSSLPLQCFRELHSFYLEQAWHLQFTSQLHQRSNQKYNFSVAWIPSCTNSVG